MAIWDTFRRAGHLTRLGLIAWAATFGVAIVQTLFFPSAKDVTPNYRGGAEGFMQGVGLYPDPAISINGFLYLPGFAVLYIPFDLLGPRLGDMLWKVAGAALFTCAAWSNCRDMERDLRVRVVSLALLLSIPLVAGSFIQGQANIHLAAACWLLTLAAFRDEVAATVLWSGLAILFKPTAIVMILLVGGVRPRTIPALAAGIAWALALPFAAGDTRYVLDLYREVWTMLTSMAFASQFVAADFTAVLTSLGLTLPPSAVTAIRGVAAAATWLAALWVAVRLPPNSAALGVFILGAAYMCLFNPRAEGLTYAMMGLPCALAVVAGLERFRAKACPRLDRGWKPVRVKETRQNKKLEPDFDSIEVGDAPERGAGRWLWASAAALLVIVGSNGVTATFLELTRFWFKPALCAIALLLIALAVLRTRSDASNVTQLFDRPKPG